MSGGVDSSVTAYLLKEQGFEVEGVSFVLWEARQRSDPAACCSYEATDSAGKTARRLGVRHSSIDARDVFVEKVIEPFVDAYAGGTTPNPCILCNRYVKFPLLLREAESRGAEYIATGHYAKIESRTAGGEDHEPEEGFSLKKGVDQRKDQSYVLYILGREELSKLRLPLGIYRKTEVRELARSLNLEAADRPESQEICFIEDRNYAGFIGNLLPGVTAAGPVKDKTGRIIGTHNGIHNYTLGQRKGLGISSLEPHYVIGIDSLTNSVVVGSREDARAGELIVSGLNWIGPQRSGPFRATVKIRSMMEDKPAVVEVNDGLARVLFDEPQWATAPGQSAVFYDGDAVIGGGTILKQTCRSTAF